MTSRLIEAPVIPAAITAEELRSKGFQPMEHDGRSFWAKTEGVDHDAGRNTAMMVLYGTDVKRLIVYEVKGGRINRVIGDRAIIEVLAARFGLKWPDPYGENDSRSKIHEGVAAAAAEAIEELPPLYDFADSIVEQSYGMKIRPEDNKFGVSMSTNRYLGEYLPEKLDQIIDEFGGDAFSRLTYSPETGILLSGTRLWVVKGIPNGPVFLAKFLERMKAVPPRYDEAKKEYLAAGSLQVDALSEELRKIDAGTPAAIRCYSNRDPEGVNQFPPSREWETMVGLEPFMKGLDEKGLQPGLQKEKSNLEDGIHGRNLLA